MFLPPSYSPQASRLRTAAQKESEARPSGVSPSLFLIAVLAPASSSDSVAASCCSYLKEKEKEKEVRDEETEKEERQ